MIKVLHLAAHLGGGVGKALSGLVQQAALTGSGISHTIVTLEEQEKPQFIQIVKRYGCEVITCPSRDELYELMESADIVQLEWWNHPLTIEALCSQSFPPMRLLVWSHVSGLYTPIIPCRLICAAQRFIFTSPCSYEAKEVSALLPVHQNKLSVVSSSGGFSDFPAHGINSEKKLKVGYIGSLNFAKLHPRYVDFIVAIQSPGFKVSLIGDIANREILEQQCIESGMPGMLVFRGYSADVTTELASINLLAYLLNPEHYGTTENALIEAMAMGIVPIVLDNPAERHIVQNHDTGLIVNSQKEFADAIEWLSANPLERERIGINAARSVRERFSVEKMESSLNSHYGDLLLVDKIQVSFTGIFGDDPADWFLSCQRYPEIFSDSSTRINRDDFYSFGLYEQSKGTVFHFKKHFPGNKRLEKWANKLIVSKLN